ncbi:MULTISPECIES: glycosyltransferase [unclassified Pseudomonas]|uniref:glycosyltransferase n=1 Tax=unclassified Pseudomonas TaxID=196821 RepID=UPI00385B1A57
MISVLMATNNCNDYLKKAVRSILDQSFEDFELLVVANGPDAKDIENFLLENFSEEKRLVIIKSDIPQLAYALNVGIEHAKFDYVARMDADDIAHPERLKLQLEYLLNNDLDVVGTDIRIINQSEEVTGYKVLPKGSSINKYLPFKNVFVHPSTLIRKSMLIKVRGYNAGFNSEDYDLWLRLKRIGVRWDNMPETLLDYRMHPGASQRRLLGYAETSGALLREFLLHKSIVNAAAVFFSILKTLFKAR